MASIPLAVSPVTKVPGLYLSVDLLAGVSSPGSSPVRAVIIAPKSSAGNLTADTELRKVFSERDAGAAFGPGSLGHLAARAVFANHPMANLHVIATDEPAGTAAEATLTFAGDDVTAMYDIELEIAGRTIRTVWAAGVTPTVIAAKVANAINAKSDDLPVTASADSGVLTLLAKGKGQWGNDIRIAGSISGGAGGKLTLSGAELAAGAGEPDLSAALSTISGMEFDFIVPCLSAEEVDEVGTTTNAKRVQNHINAYNVGRAAKLQQAVTGSNAPDATKPKAGATARNEATMQHVLCFSGRSLPCEWAGAEAGSRMARREREPNPNRMGTILRGVYGARDLVADTPSDNEIQDCLDNGVSIIGYSPQGEPVMIRPITSHSQDLSGNPDVRVLDCNEVDAIYEYAKDIRTFLPQMFYQAKVARDQAPTEEPLPDGVVEERDIKAAIVSRTTEFWIPKGVVRRDKFEGAVADGTLIVKVNDSDESQVDIVIPAAPFKALAKLGVTIQKIA